MPQTGEVEMFFDTASLKWKCPTCQAQQGSRCSGSAGQVGFPHMARVALAEKWGGQ